MADQSASSVDPATASTASSSAAPRRRLHSLTPATDAGNSLSVDPGATIEESEVDMVDYAGSFRLRYATASTVRKEKKLRKRRADNESEEEEEDGHHLGGAGGDRADGAKEREAQRQEELETQEASVKLRDTHQQSVDVSFPFGSTEPTESQKPVSDGTPPLQEPVNDSIPLQEPVNDSIPLQVEIELHPLSMQSPNNEEQGDAHPLVSNGNDITSEDASDDPEAFRFYLPHEEPKLPPEIEDRAKRAVKRLALESASPETMPVQKCFNFARSCCECEPWKYPGDDKIPAFTPEMASASTQGVRMMKTFLFPSIPRIFRDIWVALELAVTIYQFVLSAISLSLNHVEAFNIIYIVLASIALILATLDAMIHYVQLGSCATAILYVRSKFKKRSPQAQPREDTDPEKLQSCCLFSKKWRQRLNESFELLRNIVSEIILYPLLICDMFDFVVSGSYQRKNSAESINFSLFIAGGFYFVLSVYIARIIMILLSLASLRKIPRSALHTQKSYVNLIIKFGMHVLVQLASSVIIIIAVGVKIRKENSSPCNEGTCVRASGYLIYAAVAGGVIPIFGIGMFFLTNVYKMRAMTVSFWVDMVSLLQGESFTTVVFGSEGIKKAKEKAQNFAKHLHFMETKKQLKEFVQSTPSLVKRLYPLRFPFFWVLGVLYVLLLGSFLVCLALSEPVSEFETNFFDESFGLFVIVAAAILFIANLHVLFLVAVLVGLVAVILLLVILTPVFVIVGCVLYVPLGCCFGCLEYLHDISQEMSVFSKPGVHTDRIRAAVHRTKTELHK